ncbi:MAG: hypothetical protein HY706_03275 [Candidatus Hydrogenedentes bacterium]|nr:hypothetical protein [Candidatus Hydrogenedentota bacterium]
MNEICASGSSRPAPPGSEPARELASDTSDGSDRSDGARCGESQSRLQRLAPLLLILTFSVFWLYRVWWDRPAQATDAVGDVLRYYLPNLQFSLDALKDGEWPLWNPYEFAGMPMLATMEYGPLYPLNLLYALLPLDTAHLVSALIHGSALALFTYLYLHRGLRTSRASAAFGGATVAFSGWATVRMLTCPDEFRSATYLPLIFLLTDRLLERPGVHRTLALAGVLALQFLAGEIEVVARTALWLVPYGLMRLYLHRADGRTCRDFASRAAAAISAGVLALALVGIQFLPALEASWQSVRPPGPLPYEEVVRGGVENAGELLRLIMVLAGEPSLYFLGIVPLLASIYALTKWRSDAVFFGISAVFLFGLLMGDGAWASRLLYWAPTGGWFRAPVRFMPFFVFSVGVLAGIGAHRLSEDLARTDETGCVRLRLLVLLTVALLAVLTLAKYVSDVASWVALVTVAGAAGIAWLGRVRASCRLGVRGTPVILLAGQVGLALLCYDLRAVNLPRGVDLPGIPDSLRPYLRSGNRIYADFALPDGRRVPKLGALTGAPCINGYSPYMPRGFWEFVRPYRLRRLELADAGSTPPVGLWGGLGLETHAQEAFDVLGVDYIIAGLGCELFATPSAMPPQASLERVTNTGNFTVYRNPAAWPRAFVVPDTRVPDLESLTAARAGRASPAVIENYARNQVVISLPADAAGTLILTDQNYPGWRAFVDGTERPVHSIAGFLRGVRVETGARRVEFRYEPLSVKFGLAASSLALLVTVVAFLWSRVSGLRPPYSELP